MFGAGYNNPVPVFGAPATTAPAMITGAFGGPTTAPAAFVTPVTGAFGAPATVSGRVGISGTVSGGFGAPAAVSGGFGAPSTTAAPAFGGPVTTHAGFGVSSTTTTAFGVPTTVSGVFGAPATTATGAFGVPVTIPGSFGASATASGAFGAPSTVSGGFGVPSTVSGGFDAPSTLSGRFGAPSTASGGFTAPVNVSGGFGASATTKTGAFGAPMTRPFGAPVTTSRGFGAPAITKTVAFGGTTNSAFSSAGTLTTAAAANPFGKPATSSSAVFGAVKPTNVFGNPSKPYATSGNVFGAGSSSSVADKNTAVFGGSKAYGSDRSQDPAAITAFGGHGGKTAAGSSGNVFGGTSTTLASSTSLFGAPKPITTTAPAAIPSPSLFSSTKTTHSVTPAFGAPPVTTSSFSSKPASSVFSANDSPSSAIFGKAPFSKPPIAAGEAFKNPFGKPSSSSTGASKSVFGKPAAADGAPKNLFGQPPASKSDPQSVLFGKPAASVSGVSEEPAASISPFGRLSEKAKAKPAAVGESKEDSDKPGGRRSLQREGITRDSDEKKKPTGLFGRAVASVVSDPPQVGRRIVVRRGSDEKSDKQSSEPPKRSPPSGEARSPRRRTSIDDLSQYTVLMAKNVPTTVNNRVTLRKHFSRFGKVSKVYSSPAKNSAIIHFVDNESALNAKKSGGLVRSGLPKMSLFWKILTKSDVASHASQSQEVESAVGSIPKKLFSGPASDVDQEVSSLAGAGDAFGMKMRTIARPAGLKVDPLAGSITGGDRSRPQKADKGTRDRDSRRGVAKGSRRQKTRSVSPVSRLGGGLKNKEGVELKVKVVPREGSASPIPTTKPLMSVRSLIGKKCPTAQDRVDVLEARDRLLREGRKVLNKGTDLATARVIKGTCMDMCPEKERYLRQERRRLTVYEIDPGSEGRGVVDHARAVKEYSRSSADQDMPLANELRPPEVLERTMIFILNNIIELGGDGRWSDWFEYIWSRTRSIRKDITQQQLCDQMAVSLVERCARFHIYCAERLCMEDASVFDMKINDENLTKCLQTLKEMYHDLATKHGQSCPNEAEFRAYIVLMNLNQGDTLRETQQLKTEIRDSPLVKFALSVYSALNSNNYIRFFKLVRRATFLNACILHRYFGQVHSAALLTMCMAYSLPGKTAQVPICDLVRLLGFEDQEEVIMFCEHYGLPTENDCISMMRHNFDDPETALPIRRAKTLIETKLTTSPGEVLHGGPLPPNEILTSTSSFDAEGRFCPDALTLQVVQQQEGDWQPTPVSLPAPIAASPSPLSIPSAETPSDQSVRSPIELPASPQEVPSTKAEAEQVPTRHPYSNDAVKAVAKEIFLEVIQEVCGEMSQSLVQTCQVFLNTASPLTDDFLDQQVPTLTRELSEEVVQEERDRVEQEARARAEMSIRRERLTVQLGSDLTEETVHGLALEVAREEKGNADRQLRKESLERCSAAYIKDLLLSVLTSETAKLTTDFFNQEVLKKRRSLARAEDATRVLRQQRHFRQWKNKLAGRQRLKWSMLDFPAAPSMNTPRERLEHILPESTGLCEERNAVHLGRNAWLTLTPPNVVVEKENELIREILRQNDEARQKEALSVSSIDVCRVVGPPLVKKLREAKNRPMKSDVEQVYWKLLLSLPRAETDGQLDYQEWIVNKLSTPDDHFPPEIFNSTVQVIGKSSGLVPDANGQPVSVNVIVRHMIGLLKDVDLARAIQGRHLQATNAVLFVLDRTAMTNSQMWAFERRRLQQVLSVYDLAKLSLVITAPYDMMAICHSRLTDLCHGLFFYTIMPLCEDVLNPISTVQMQESVGVLAMNSVGRDRLESEWITDYLQHGLQRFFFSKLQNSVFSGSPEHLLNQVPSEMVGLYNASIHHLAQVACDPDLRRVSWPPTEFSCVDDDLPAGDWNSGRSLKYVGRLLGTLALPPCEVPEDQHGDLHWDEACDLVWNYVRTVVTQTKGTSVFLVSRVHKLLQQAREAFEDQCMWTCGLAKAEPSSTDLPWSRVLKLCIDHKLSFLNILVPGANQNQLDYNELRVYYKPDRMDYFDVPTEWLSVCRQSPDHSALETSIRRAVKRRQDDLTTSILEASSKSSRLSLMEIKTPPPRLDLEPIDPLVLEVQAQASELLGEMAVETKAMADYERFLEDLIKEGELPLPPVPQLDSLNNSF